jgi:methylthioribose-1-phosphate isomerase
MRIDGQSFRTIWVEGDAPTVRIIDQTALPHRLAIRTLGSAAEAAEAIASMRVRGAPLIGAAAAYGYALGAREDPADAALERVRSQLLATRPTAVNLRWALDVMRATVLPRAPAARAAAAFERAAALAEADVATCRAIGEQGRALIEAVATRNGGAPVNVLTHCNAGWLATVDWGTALAPIYAAHRRGVAMHVWVDETRPRNQGASLTAFELAGEGVAHTIVADNAGGHLMQQGRVDLCLVGSDRTAANGDVANKIGTYLKALAARDNGVPFYVALPHSTIDWGLASGVGSIPIEERSAREVTHVTGLGADGTLTTVAITPPGSPAANPAFDVTPARLVTGLITERGVAAASRAGLLRLYPEQAGTAA